MMVQARTKTKQEDAEKESGLIGSHLLVSGLSARPIEIQFMVTQTLVINIYFAVTLRPFWHRLR